MSTGTTVPTTNGTFDPEDVKRKDIDEKLHTAFNEEQIEVLDALYSGGGGGSDSIWKPDVTDEGVISWERSSSASKPVSRNIKGPKGDTGEQGPKGDKGDKGDAGDVDEAMSDSSVNAVQNKVIKQYVDDAIGEKQDTLTAGDNITIDNNIISADDGVFVAVYEQTSYADVKAAIDAHKAIVLDMPSNNNQFCITFSTYTNGGNALMYAIFKMSDRPTLMTVTLTPQNQWRISHTDLQDALVSGTNIKTINNESLLGSGNIDIQGGSGNADFDITPEHNLVATSANGEHLIFDFTETDLLTARASIPGSWEKSKILAAKNYVDTEAAKKQNRLVYNGDFTYTASDASAGGSSVDAILPDVGYFNGKLGMNLAVGKETWYGTYTDENDVTYQVYTKTIYIPALPATAGITTYDHGVENIKQILSIYGFTTDGFVLNAPRQTVTDNISIYQASKSASNKTFSIEVGKDRSNKKAYVTMVYAKNN